MFLMTSDPKLPFGSICIRCIPNFRTRPKIIDLVIYLMCIYIYTVYYNYQCIPHGRGRQSTISLLFNPQHFLEETHSVHHGYYMVLWCFTTHTSSPFGVPEGAWVDASDSAKDQSLWGGSAISDASAWRGAAVGLHGDFMGNLHEFSSQFVGIYD